MPEAPVTALGLPLIAVVSFSRDWETGETDADVDELYWRKRDGSRGAHVSEKIWDKIENTTWGFCTITEQASEYWAYEDWQNRVLPEIAVLLFQGGVQDNETIDGLFRFDQ